MIVCPGLAFGMNCSRLGRGKGYYDKYISKCHQMACFPFMVGLAFDEQMTSTNLALEETDRHLSAVIYPAIYNKNTRPTSSKRPVSPFVKMFKYKF